MNEKKESHQIIRKLFIGRIKHYDLLERDRWHQLKDWVFYATPKQIEQSLNEFFDNI